MAIQKSISSFRSQIRLHAGVPPSLSDILSGPDAISLKGCVNVAMGTAHR